MISVPGTQPGSHPGEKDQRAINMSESNKKKGYPVPVSKSILLANFHLAARVHSVRSQHTT